MSINQRIREIREYLGFTQEEFGKRINIKSRAHISALEGGARSVTDRIANDICRVYGINKEWLMTGKGEMRSNTETAFLDDILEELGATDPIDLEIIRLYFQLDEKYKEAFRVFVKQIAKKGE